MTNDDLKFALHDQIVVLALPLNQTLPARLHACFIFQHFTGI
jgi:hypothetical protein